MAAVCHQGSAVRLLCLFLFICCAPLQAAETVLRVAVAANFRAAMEEQLLPAFTATHQVQVELSSASTGMLHNQIRHGAPFHLLLAADNVAPAALAASGEGVADTLFCYARGRLVLVGGELAQLQDHAHSIAIGNPALAPYGRAAEQVLARPDFASGAARKRVLGSNVLQALQFWHSGSVDLALLPRSLAPDGLLIPARWHEPIEQQGILLQRGADLAAARALLAWLQGPEAGTGIRRAGYDPCS
ncbi:molybdate ABC transporter substrate-binding protein [Kineobactrum salinum]|uniref:Molybdate ABC transporter substrate-binding protein n=1 Tax=Kineobactrum salinum TaxID=2708301 RepID=A0A6C0U1G7_9GAMM|nr:molybdate ABC transporter substrate-binding protein [Kineobactrum salinum]QIB65856.1 molybdate ABC transporter substrate-binding protein [Kineobactrum salinum]